jgi:drug/metabolite transporter (DMT)-like permease
MIGLVLWIIWTFFEELNNSLLKEKSKKYHYVTVWVIMSCFSLLVFIVMWLYKTYSGDLELIFNTASIPLLIVRLIFEVLQSYFTLLAIKQCDRSTFSILRVLTIPLLVIADVVLWYQFTSYSLIWIGIILFSFIWFNSNHRTINWKGWYFALFTAINAVITLSLFKYSITHYGNSLEIDQWIMALWTVIFFIWYNLKKERKIGLYLLKKEKIFWIQWILMALTSIILSYSYLYLNASEATAVKRAWEMFWSVLAGFVFFQETNFIKKILFALCIILGLIVMVL